MSWYDPSSWGDSDEKNQKIRDYLASQSKQAGRFGTSLQQGLAGYNTQLGGQFDYLRGLQSGQNSLSAEQLRQGLQQNLAAQRSMAASASPQNAPMAARTAAIQGGRLGAGMSGAAALAGIQERQAAGNSLTQALLGARGQNIQGANTSFGTAIGGFGAIPQEQSWWKKNAEPLNALASAATYAI